MIVYDLPKHNLWGLGLLGVVISLALRTAAGFESSELPPILLRFSIKVMHPPDKR